MPFINSNEKCAKLLCMSKKSSNFDLLPHKWGPLRTYVLSMSEQRSPLLLPFELPSQGSSPPAGHTQRRVFFVQPNGFRILHPYISSYASIAAIYRHKIQKIAFYGTKNARMFAYVQFLL